MMKNISAMVALVMSVVLPTIFVHAETQSLNGAIQQLNYSLTVQWDQQDAQFKANAYKVFAGQIEQLQKEGMTQGQLVEALKLQLNDAKLIADLDLLAAIAKEKNMTAAQTNALVAQYAMKAQKEGASWTGSSGGGMNVGVIIAVIVVIVVIILIINNNTGSSTPSNPCTHGGGTRGDTLSTTWNNNGNGCGGTILR